MKEQPTPRTPDEIVDEMLRDTFGVTDEGLQKLTDQAIRDRRDKVPHTKGRSGSYPDSFR